MEDAMAYRRPNILDHFDTAIKDAYRCIPTPHFGKSDHNAVFLLPAYKQKLKHEDPAQKVVHVSKTKELIIDFRKKGGGHAAIYINGAEVERVESVKFLGVMI
eukprot:g33087.t1